MNGLADEFGLIVAYPHQTRRANPVRLLELVRPATSAPQGPESRPSSPASTQAAGATSSASREGSRFSPPACRRAARWPRFSPQPTRMSSTPSEFTPACPTGSAVDMPSAFAAMKGTAAGAFRARRARTSGGCRKIVFHGGADATVHPANGERILDEAARGAGPLAANRSRLGDRRPGACNRTALQDAEGRPVVERWLVEGGGHAWFGGDPQRHLSRRASD